MSKLETLSSLLPSGAKAISGLETVSSSLPSEARSQK